MARKVVCANCNRNTALLHVQVGITGAGIEDDYPTVGGEQCASCNYVWTGRMPTTPKRKRLHKRIALANDAADLGDERRST